MRRAAVPVRGTLCTVALALKILKQQENRLYSKI